MAISKFTTAKVSSQKGKCEVTDIGEEVQDVNITVRLDFATSRSRPSFVSSHVVRLAEEN